MSSLDKLAIRGIRSFDDKNIAVIEFFTPVTVIVGHNGSGKTTIIECLKYATTGEQPPNTRGGAFVHDPKMANEKEVKAQVKLRFHSANGTRMLAIRNLSVTVKKTSGLTMKTLESILGLDDTGKTGKRAVISTKCAEMDVEIPQLLGVSKAVLENVIFCHQEDSYWPLAEPSVLKKKFDEIFEATKYTKALDSIKSLRKDRVADLKAEQERLSSLKLQKDRADKLRTRMKDLNATMASKEGEYDAARDQHEEAVESNRKFYEYGTKFREIYLKVENLEEKKRGKQKDLEEARDGNFQAIAASDDELQSRLNQFDHHVNGQQQTLLQEERERGNLEDKLARHRQDELRQSEDKARLEAEAEVHKGRIAERQHLVNEINKQFGMNEAISSQTALDKAQVNQFLSRMGEIKKKQTADLERLQSEVNTKMEEFNGQLRQLDSQAQTHKIKRTSLREQVSERNASIKQASRKVEGQHDLQSNLSSLKSEMEDKRDRLEKLRQSASDAKHEARLQEKQERSRMLEEKREALMEEVRQLSTQADSRAKLDLKRGEIRTKNAEVQSLLKLAESKFEEVANEKLDQHNSESQLERILRDKEEAQEDLEEDLSRVKSEMSSLDAEIKSVKSQIAAKTAESNRLQKLADRMLEPGESMVNTIRDTILEIDGFKHDLARQAGSAVLYEEILSSGKTKRKCMGCNRALADSEMRAFEAHLKERINEANEPKDTERLKKEIAKWEAQLVQLQADQNYGYAAVAMRADLPGLQKTLAEHEGSRPNVEAKVNSIERQLDELKASIKSLANLKQQVNTVTRLKKEVERAEKEVIDLETELSISGSTKTVDEVQIELNEVTSEVRALEKERQTISAERERQTSAIHVFESRLNDLRLDEQKMLTEIAEASKLAEQVEQMKKDVVTFTAQIKELDGKISEAQAPIAALEDEQKQVQQDLNNQISQVQAQIGQLNAKYDKLAVLNKDVDRYIRDRRDRHLEDCIASIARSREEQITCSSEIQDCRDRIKAIEKEINESGASQTNLRENIRVRKLQKEISDIQAEIESYDVEEAAKARRNFQEQWEKKKEKEERLNKSVHHLAGELSSLRSSQTTLESDLKEFKDVNKKYTEQLVKVKISDMANSDLEKYAKALDNAIMKYHGLKMEEVNDTMKHLWNKTYQGTDIDGIKIRSDVEGGASKRSYNYRVVMTKDQVEMDMRGRCSAGQKMLASIIIRLALSDSFGQNCGILALDEPTNALDTENIDALAESLVDIINERKSHSNFQLIIITHDENFLRKLGHNDVMEHYWRVTRDARQKSVIERQRFR